MATRHLLSWSSASCKNLRSQRLGTPPNLCTHLQAHSGRPMSTIRASALLARAAPCQRAGSLLRASRAQRARPCRTRAAGGEFNLADYHEATISECVPFRGDQGAVAAFLRLSHAFAAAWAGCARTGERGPTQPAPLPCGHLPPTALLVATLRPCRAPPLGSVRHTDSYGHVIFLRLKDGQNSMLPVYIGARTRRCGRTRRCNLSTPLPAWT